MRYAPRITPDLPTGLTYTITSVGNQHTIQISGTPKQGLNPRLFYLGYNAYVSTVEISGNGPLAFLFLSLCDSHLLQLWLRFDDSVHERRYGAHSNSL